MEYDWKEHGIKCAVDNVIYNWKYYEESWLTEDNDNYYLELHTVGWSDNETIIQDVLAVRCGLTMFYTKWERGGHYYFEFPKKYWSQGFKKVDVEAT